MPCATVGVSWCPPHECFSEFSPWVSCSPFLSGSLPRDPQACQHGVLDRSWLGPEVQRGASAPALDVDVCMLVPSVRAPRPRSLLCLDSRVHYRKQ